MISPCIRSRTVRRSASTKSSVAIDCHKDQGSGPDARARAVARLALVRGPQADSGKRHGYLAEPHVS
eukprot:5797980-Prymnesium_polylepis.1